MIAIVACAIAAFAAQTPQMPATLGIGRSATPAEISAWDIDVRPDGVGLPPGRGAVTEGETIYAARCASCHGKTGKEGPNDRLVGRVTVDEVLDFVRQRGEEERLAQGGLREEEDVFASVWKSFQNRWAWLAINLVMLAGLNAMLGAEHLREDRLARVGPEPTPAAASPSRETASQPQGLRR